MMTWYLTMFSVLSVTVFSLANTSYWWGSFFVRRITRQTLTILTSEVSRLKFISRNWRRPALCARQLLMVFTTVDRTTRSSVRLTTRWSLVCRIKYFQDLFPAENAGQLCPVWRDSGRKHFEDWGSQIPLCLLHLQHLLGQSERRNLHRLAWRTGGDLLPVMS